MACSKSGLRKRRSSSACATMLSDVPVDHRRSDLLIVLGIRCGVSCRELYAVLALHGATPHRLKPAWRTFARSFPHPHCTECHSIAKNGAGSSRENQNASSTPL